MAEKIALKIEAKVDGKPVSLSLTESEVLTGASICEKNNVESVSVVKKHNGGALFFLQASNVENYMQRHKVDYSFDVEAKDLAPKAAEILKSREASAKKTNQGG